MQLKDCAGKGSKIPEEIATLGMQFGEARERGGVKQETGLKLIIIKNTQKKRAKVEFKENKSFFQDKKIQYGM